MNNVNRYRRRLSAITVEAAVVLPVIDGSDVCGIGVFNATVEDAAAIMDDDPGVAAGVFTYQVHPCRGFPGDALP